MKNKTLAFTLAKIFAYMPIFAFAATNADPQIILSGNTINAESKVESPGNSLTAESKPTVAPTKTAPKKKVDPKIAKAELKKVILKTIEKQPDQAVEAVREFLQYADAEDVVFLIKLVNKYEKKLIAEKIKKEMLALTYPNRFYINECLVKAGNDLSAEVNFTAAEMLFEKEEKTLAIRIVPTIIRKGMTNSRVIDFLEQMKDPFFYSQMGVGLGEVERDGSLPAEVRVFALLVNNAFNSPGIGYQKDMVVKVLLSAKYEYFKNTMRLIDKAFISIKEARKGEIYEGFDTMMIRELSKSQDPIKNQLAKEIMEKHGIPEVKVEKYPEDHLVGLLFSNKKSEYGQFLPEIKTLMDQIQLLIASKCVDEETFKKGPPKELLDKLHDPDYRVRGVAYISLMPWPNMWEKSEIQYRGDNDWKPYVGKLMIDLKHISESEDSYFDTNYYINPIALLMAKLPEIAIPLLEMKANDEQASEKYRYFAIGMLGGIAQINSNIKVRILDILRRKIGEKNEMLRSRINIEIKTLEGKQP